MSRCERCDRPVTPWDVDREAAVGECPGGGACDGTATDWRARALAAEAALADAKSLESKAVSMWSESELEARASRGDAGFGTALFSVVRKTIADAEARGRQHGLLAAAMLAEASIREAVVFQRGETNATGYSYWEGVMDEDGSLLNDLAVLATESA